MRTATVSDLRDHCSNLIGWMSGGEEIVITQDGKPLARLIPEKHTEQGKVNWRSAL